MFVLPMSALIHPLPVPDGGVNDTLVSLVFAVFLIPVFVFGKPIMSRLIGVLFLITYAVYMTGRAYLS